SCVCTLCQLREQLLADLDLNFSGSLPGLLKSFATVEDLLAALRKSQADAVSDQLFRQLFSAQEIHADLGVRILVLAFLPLLHSTARRIAKFQEALGRDDIAQQSLRVLLEYLESRDLRARDSHFAFAISRAVKRRMFRWAKRQGPMKGVRGEQALELLTVDE